jgi:hypothetical protein
MVNKPRLEPVDVDSFHQSVSRGNIDEAFGNLPDIIAMKSAARLLHVRISTLYGKVLTGDNLRECFNQLGGEYFYNKRRRKSQQRSRPVIYNEPQAVNAPQPVNADSVECKVKCAMCKQIKAIKDPVPVYGMQGECCMCMEEYKDGVQVQFLECGHHMCFTCMTSYREYQSKHK